MDAPPSRTRWALEGELRGRSPLETILWASWTADYEDEVAARRSLPVGAVLADAEPR